MCNDGEIRLVNGMNAREGRVEVCLNEAWGTICDNSFDEVDGSVICGQLGFSRRSTYSNVELINTQYYTIYSTFISSDVQALSGATFGQGTGDPLLDILNCLGNETNLLQCDSDSSNAAICPHTKDAGVVCPIRPCEKNIIASFDSKVYICLLSLQLSPAMFKLIFAAISLPM